MSEKPWPGRRGAVSPRASQRPQTPRPTPLPHAPAAILTLFPGWPYNPPPCRWTVRVRPHSRPTGACGALRRFAPTSERSLFLPVPEHWPVPEHRPVPSLKRSSNRLRRPGVTRGPPLNHRSSSPDDGHSSARGIARRDQRSRSARSRSRFVRGLGGGIFGTPRLWFGIACVACVSGWFWPGSGAIPQSFAQPPASPSASSPSTSSPSTSVETPRAVLEESVDIPPVPVETGPPGGNTVSSNGVSGETTDGAGAAGERRSPAFPKRRDRPRVAVRAGLAARPRGHLAVARRLSHPSRDDRIDRQAGGRVATLRRE